MLAHGVHAVRKRELRRTGAIICGGRRGARNDFSQGELLRRTDDGSDSRDTEMVCCRTDRGGGESLNIFLCIPPSLPPSLPPSGFLCNILLISLSLSHALPSLSISLVTSLSLPPSLHPSISLAPAFPLYSSPSWRESVASKRWSWWRTGM
eukprot:1824507-Rhodomonas_salina.2